MNVATSSAFEARAFAFGLVLLRVGLGLVFLTNGIAKLTGWDGVHPFPGFLITLEGARGSTEYNAQTHPVRLYYDFIHDFLLPNWAFFGPMITLTELFIGVSLVLGLLSPLGALVGAGFALHLNFMNWDRNIWMWEYAVEWLPLMALALMRPGRYWGLDQLLARRVPWWPFT